MQHRQAVGPLTITVSHCPPTLGLRGDVDILTVSHATRALETLAIEGAGDVIVDLTGLEFMGIEGLRLLCETARSFSGGRRLIVNGTPLHLSRVCALIGWDQTPNLVLNARPAKGTSAATGKVIINLRALP